MKSSLYNSKPYVIAETAYTFEGDSQYLIEQTDKLTTSADAIKYHLMFDADEYAVSSFDLVGHLKKWILTETQWLEILRAAKKKDLDVVVLTDDRLSVEFCVDNHELIDAIEIHAACINDYKLVEQAVAFANKFDKVMILGISGFEIEELQQIVDFIKSKNVKHLLLMYGFQNFPTKIEDVNLCKMPIYKSLFECSVGYADHTEHTNDLKEQLIGTAFTLGANIQEVHYVLQEGEKKTDYITAVGNERFIQIKSQLDNIYNSLGSSNFKLNNGERAYLNFRKVPVLSRNVKKGQLFDINCIEYKRVEKPSRQYKFMEIEEFVGRVFNNDYSIETEINSMMISEE